ncbi:MAG: extracellular solute-binding protein [Anaerolineae bacterium]|nr:extracellular solute-binding protein [Anaerolineae bacterium]
MKKFFIFTLMMTLLVSFGLVNAQDDALAGVDPTGAVITYWHEWDGEQQVGIDAVIDAFEASNEWGITVEQVQLGSSRVIRENMSTGIVSGELPNLTGAAFVQSAQNWYLDGVIVPLDVYYDHPEYGFSEEELAQLNQDLLDINRPAIAPYDGQLLTWPVGMSANVLTVNLEMLAELGFDGPPTDLETFREIACAANELTSFDDGDVQGFPVRTSAFDMWSFMVAQGGVVFDTEANRYNITDDASIATLQFFQDLFNDGCAYLPDGPFVNTADFAFGLNPMAVGSSVGVPFIQGDINDSGSGIENWVNTTVPWSEGNRTIQPSLRGVAIIDSTPEENLATWLFLKFWATDMDAQVAWTEGAQYQPYNNATRDALSQEFLDANLQFTSIFNALGDESINIWSPPAHPSGRDVSSVFEELIVNILTGGADVAEAAADAEVEMNEIYQEDLDMLGG